MGKRGPPPKPTALKLVTGNPGKRALNKREPKSAGQFGPPPAHLDSVGKNLWRQLAKTLAGMALESASDRRALELLCSAYEEWRAARRIVVRDGMTYERSTAQGDTIISIRPEVRIAADAMRRLHRMMLEFGLTPSARSRVTAGEQDAADPMDEFLKAGRG
jgi:P27 family predicted phage terminase small subunit